jgi:hypothetical protein
LGAILLLCFSVVDQLPTALKSFLGAIFTLDFFNFVVIRTHLKLLFGSSPFHIRTTDCESIGELDEIHRLDINK